MFVSIVFARQYKGGYGGAYSPAVSNRPAHDTPGIASGSDFQWEDLGWVQPGHGEPCRAEDHGVQEHEEGGGASDLAGVLACGDFVDCGTGEPASCEHANALAYGTPVESPASANAVECEDAEECSKL